MDAFWGYSGWWCVLPLLAFGLLALGCMLMRGRHACACGHSMQREDSDGRRPPGGPAA